MIPFVKVATAGARIRRVIAFIGGVILFATSAALAATGGSGGSGKNAMDIAVINRALATAKPGDTRVKFGDCYMLISDLQIYRARLQAEQDPTGIYPAADTPTSNSKWPNGVVYYQFDPTQILSGTLTPAKMQMFRDGVGEWEAAANVQFVEFTGTPPTNYITVQEEPNLGGGESTAVGMQGGQQFLQFGPQAWNRGTVCHEAGHALGYIHEQQRDDRDTYVVIDWSNISTDNQPNFTKLPGGSTAIGAYDFYSIMHYSRNAEAIDSSQDTITMQPAYAQYQNVIGMVTDRILSTLDRAGMASIYGNPTVAPSGVVTNTKDSGPGSLRSALYYSIDSSNNTPPTAVTITFQIPKTDPNYNSSTGVFTITPTYMLPAPGSGTTIDGTTQTAFTGDTNPSGPEIVISGASQALYEGIGAGYQPAFILRQSNCVVKGIDFNGYDVQALQIEGALAAGNPEATVATGNVISGCYLGTDPTGTSSVPDLGPGIEIYGGAYGNTIGGTTAAARNIISGGTGLGIYIHDTGSTGNVVEGNYIGLNAAGTTALPNANGGIQIGLGAQNNTIGGTSATARNVISGNLYQGVVMTNTNTSGNLVEGNYIGLNAAGTAAVGNGFQDVSTHYYLPGVGIFNGAAGNTIGGTATGSGNVISGNAAGGVSISGTGGNGNLVQGNLIGTNPSGTAAIANGTPEANYEYAGVEIFGGAQSNTIGGTTAAARNIISGNGSQGVYIGDPGTSLNLVEGNYIGTNLAGTGAVANGFSGVGIFNSASSNTIGGTAAGTLNVISGNLYQGVAIGNVATGQTVGPTLNVVEGNYIGVNVNGTGALGNGSAGVDVYGSSQSNTIGGTTAAARNIISGNAYQDVAVSDSGTTGNLVIGNYVGLDKTGTVSIANSNSGVGIFNSATSNTIGGTTAGSRNYISGHQQYGIFISDSGTTGNSVLGNTIGLNVSSAAVPNVYPGVGIFNGAQSNKIGGTVAGSGNIIAGNSAEGVALYDSTTFDDSISENSIYGNNIGIGVYSGSNNNQAAPVLTSAVEGATGNATGTNIGGTLASAASTTYRIEFFSSPSGNEGQTFIGSVNVTTNSSGSATIAASLSSGVASGSVVTATATDPNGNTSEFSAPETVTAGTGGGLQSQTITFPAIGNQTYTTSPITLNATASSGLPVMYSITSGSATLSGSLLTITGVSTITVKASQTGNASYSAATPVSQSFTVSKASQTLTFPTIGNQVVGAVINLNGSASSGLPVYYTTAGPVTVSGNTATITGAGSISIRIHQDGNADYAAAATILQTFTATASTKTSQTITFPAIGNQPLSASPITLQATASSGLPVSFSLISGPATLSGSSLTLTGTGTVTVQASQAGNTTYNPAPNVQQSFTVTSGGPQSQTITFPTIGNQTYTTTPITLQATASSGLPVMYSITSGSATLSGNDLTITGVSTITVKASQSGNASYSAATPVSQSFTVSKASQTLTFPTIGNQVVGAVINLNGSASSGLPVYYTTAGPITVSGNTATITGAGSISIRIHQDGNSDYAAAATILQTFTATASTKTSQTITFPAIGNQPLSASPITLQATASSGLPVSYSASGPATVSGSTLTLTGTGTVTVTASQAGNATYNPAPNVQQSFTVTSGGPQSQTITFPAIGNQTYTTTPITLTATASSGLPVMYSITSGSATLSGSSLTITGVSTITVKASQSGNASYSAATPVSQSFTVSKASQTLTFPTIGTQTAGTSFPLNGSSSSGLPVYYTTAGPITVSGNTATVTAAGTVSIRIHQDGNADYTAATTILQTFTVVKAGG